MDVLSLVLAVAVLSTAIVVALRREADRYAARQKARRRREQIARVTVALRGLQPAFAQLRVGMLGAAAAFERFGDSLQEIHRTAAKPAHRARRAER